MAKIVGIFGDSGSGKTTATIINPDGTYNFEDGKYQGMDPSSHVIINLDGKELPIPGGMWCKEKQNYVETHNLETIIKVLISCAKNPQIKSISLDTLNLYLSFREYNDRKKLSFDQWRDISNDIIELLTTCNSLLRPDQIVYIFGHTDLQTQPDGTEKRILSVIGKKLKKNPPEAYFPIVLMTRIEYGEDGDNKYYFETKAASSTAKTPLNMFNTFLIPNSLALVDKTIREYYKI